MSAWMQTLRTRFVEFWRFPGTGNTLDAGLRAPVLIGATVTFLFFGVFGAWAAFAPLAGGAIAPGIVSPEGSRKTVQHLEGGIIREILVRDGDRVATGDPLIVLEETQARANFEVLQRQRRAFAAMEARLLAEQSQKDEIAFPVWLEEAGLTDADARAAMEAEEALFETRRETMASTVDILNERIAQLREEIEGFHAQIASDEVQLGLISEEAAGVEALVRKGLERKPRLLALQRREAEIASALAGKKAAIARAERQIGETEIRISATRSQMLDEVAERLTDVRTRLGSIEEEIEARRDVLQRTVIHAPVAGTVVAMRVSTPGGVIRPGDAILDIVPEGGDLIVDARVAPTDIDIVHAGLEAQVRLTSFSQRTLPPVKGTVLTVSADSLEDERTGDRYFKAKVHIEAEALAALGGNIQLTPGMPADVLIVTGERTFLSYLMRPITDSFRRSFREE